MKKTLLFFVFLTIILSAGSALAGSRHSITTERWTQYATIGGEKTLIYDDTREIESHPVVAAKADCIKKIPQKRTVTKKKPPRHFWRHKCKPMTPPNIKLPSEGEYITHVIEKGETLGNHQSIAKKFGTTPEVIWALNKDKIKNPHCIKAGWRLTVPKKEAVAVTSKDESQKMASLEKEVSNLREEIGRIKLQIAAIQSSQSTPAPAKEPQKKVESEKKPASPESSQENPFDFIFPGMSGTTSSCFGIVLQI